ncbi:MAG: hypothetical protein J5857_10830 [Treponema sp.]|nr:hypothetical protein [Treponema sp.]
MKKTIRAITVAAVCIYTVLSLTGCLSLDFSSTSSSSGSSGGSSVSGSGTVSLSGKLYDEQTGEFYMEGQGIKFIDSKKCIFCIHYEPPYTFEPGTYTVDAAKKTVTITLNGTAFMDEKMTMPWESDEEPEPYKKYFVTHDNFETLIELSHGDPTKETFEYHLLDISDWE